MNKEKVETKNKTIDTKNKSIFISIILILIYLLLMRVLSSFFYRFQIVSYDNYYLWSGFIHIFIAIVFLCITKKLGLLNIFKEKGKGFFYTICTAGFIFIFLTYSLAEDLEMLAEEGKMILLPFWNCFGFILDMLIGAGLCEELLFRGLIQNLLIKDVEKFDKKQVWKIVFLSGLFFGLAHLSNYFAGASFEGAFYQMLGAIAVGMYFSAIYLRGNNFLAMVFLHFYNDFAILVTSGLFGEGMDLMDTISSYDSLKLIGVVLYTCIALFLLRKKKMNEIIEYRNGIIEKEIERKKAEELEFEKIEDDEVKQEVKRLVEENYKEE